MTQRSVASLQSAANVLVSVLLFFQTSQSGKHRLFVFTQYSDFLCLSVVSEQRGRETNTGTNTYTHRKKACHHRSALKAMVYHLRMLLLVGWDVNNYVIPCSSVLMKVRLDSYNGTISYTNVLSLCNERH